MAHEIRSTDRMIYTGETPWHDREEAFTEALSVQDAIDRAGLDWTVRREQLYLADGTTVDRFAVVRNTDNRVLGTVGTDWRPIQNSKAFSVLEPFVAAGQATVETAGSLFDGGRVWMLLKISRPDAVIVPGADDRVSKHVLAAVGHDGTLSFTLGITPIRVVCNNTLSVALGDGLKTHVKIRHTAGGNAAVDALAATINEIDGRIEKAAEVFRALAGVSITSEKQLRAYITSVFPPPKKAPKALDMPAPAVESFSDLLGRPTKIDASVASYTGTAPVLTQPDEEEGRRIFDSIINLFENGRGNRTPGVRGTAWAAYNAVTEYNSWERGRSVDSRLNNVWLQQSGPVARALPAAVNRFLSASASGEPWGARPSHPARRAGRSEAKKPRERWTRNEISHNLRRHRSSPGPQGRACRRVHDARFPGLPRGAAALRALPQPHSRRGVRRAEACRGLHGRSVVTDGR
jgi:phage/plasmid-like protein (TIGR03299 family)